MSNSSPDAAKVELLGRIAPDVAHDFGNILMGAKSCVSMALKDLPEDSPARRYLDEAKRSLERGASLTHQFVSFSRDIQVGGTAVDVNLVLRDLDLLIKRIVGSTAELSLQIEPICVPTTLDGALLAQAILSLVLGARDALMPVASLTIRISLPPQSEANRNTLNRPETTLLITIKGTVPADEALLPMQSPAVARAVRILEQAGGRIETVCDGPLCTFRCFLPDHSDISLETPSVRAPSTPPRVPGAKEAPIANRATILLVEDEESSRLALCDHLSDLGYRVLGASTPSEALALCRANGKMDVLLTDYDLPEMSGVRLALQVENVCPSIGVVVMSGYTNVELAPGQRLITKPLDLDAVANIVQTSAAESAVL